MPVAVGTAAAASHGAFHPGVLVAALVSSLFIQVGTNLANDLFDFRKGADTAERQGPLRVTQAGLLSEAEVQAGMFVSFGAAAAVGMYLVAIGGWPILAIGLAGIASGILYTAGRRPLGYLGLGDVFVFVFFGVLGVCGTYYLHAGALDVAAFIASVPVGSLATAILVVNNLRDIETDRKAGKNTLAVRIGASATRAEYVLCLVAAFAAPALVWVIDDAARSLLWLPVLSLPLAVRLGYAVVTSEPSAQLNLALKGTGRLHLLFGLLFSVGLLW